MAYRLLLADDSITIQKVVELVLAEEDFQIKSVSNGEDAINLLDTFKPDIVLADIEMPKVNGYNLCEKIKKNPSTSHVPVILLAGAFEPIDEDLARQVGADDSVIKPFESQELISKINAALTMVSADTEQAALSADEEVFEAVEEADIFAESEAVGVEGGEAVGAEGIEEDLWSMEEIPETAEEVVEEKGIEEAFEVMQESPASAPKLKPEPVREEEVVRPAAGGVVITEADMPSKEEILRRFEKVIDEKVASLLSELDIKEALLSSLVPSMKDAVEKVLWEVAPELAEKVLKEILKSSVSSLTTEVEKVIWETVPDLATTMISREIEKIKSEF
ncbi:MAG: response regulator receiver protein [Nitrospirae bacterium]|nr:response regulator receiver protein [Nitrospirota bacterium]